MPVLPDLQFDPAREEAELREYLGSRFEPDRLWHYQRQLDEEFAETGDEGVFYRTSEGYLYNLAVFAMSGTKLPYLHALMRHVPPPAHLLDYGCGIGSDGLMLLEAGYRVAFADFANPSTNYLRWRLARRGFEASIYDLDDHVPGGFDATYAFDVIEHVRDPFHFLGEMESRANLVEVNFLEPEPNDQALHYDLPIDPLLAHVATHPIHRYRVLHGRSHLVLYSSSQAGLTTRIMNRAWIAVRRSVRRKVPRG